MIWIVTGIAITAIVKWYLTDREMIRQLGVILQLRADVAAANTIVNANKDLAEHWQATARIQRDENIALARQLTGALRLAGGKLLRADADEDDSGDGPTSIAQNDREAAQERREALMREMVPLRVAGDDVAPARDQIEDAEDADTDEDVDRDA